MTDGHNDYTVKYKITASDMDVTYRITPNAVLMYFQDCFANYLSSRRLAAFDIVDEGMIWMITEFSVSFVDKRPLWSDDIFVEISIDEISPIRVYVGYRVYDGMHSLFAEGSSTWVIMDVNAKRPCPAKSFLESKGVYVARADRKVSKRTVAGGKLYHDTIEHQVNIADLDFNGHVCNRSYLALATSTAPVDFIYTHDPEYVQIKFIRESFFGDKLICKVYKHESVQSYWHEIFNSDGVEICKVYSEWTEHDAYDCCNIRNEIRRPGVVSSSEV